MTPQFILLIFNSTNFTMQAELEIKKIGISVQIMPTPREITLSCGLSIKVQFEALEKIKNLIEIGNIKVKEIYSLTGEGKNKILEKI